MKIKLALLSVLVLTTSAMANPHRGHCNTRPHTTYVRYQYYPDNHITTMPRRITNCDTKPYNVTFPKVKLFGNVITLPVFSKYNPIRYSETPTRIYRHAIID
jgi:hypothetical protein